MRNLLSIGTLSNASHLSVKALRRYHELGLLVPAAVDARTGYRGYSVAQITDARIIRRLRQLDVPLEDIARILRSGAPEVTASVLGEHRTRMKLRLEETERIVSDLQRLVDEPGDLHRVLVHERWQAPQPIVAVTVRTAWAELKAFFDATYPKLAAHVARHGGRVDGPAGASYGSGDGIDHDDLTVSAWLPVEHGLPADADAAITSGRLPETRLAVALHVGAFEDMSATYGAVGRWVAQHDRVVTGPLQELYLAGPPEVAEVAAWRTEVGWPVSPAPEPEQDEDTVMTATLANITVDCADVERVARFWAAVLDRKVGDQTSPYFASLPATQPGEPIWLFLKVPESKAAKNRMHVDLTAPDRDAEVARMVELGATRIEEKTEYGLSWVIMNDPEGNEYCIAQADQH